MSGCAVGVCLLQQQHVGSVRIMCVGVGCITSLQSLNRRTVLKGHYE